MKKKFKNRLLGSHNGDEAETLKKIVQNISLYKNVFFFPFMTVAHEDAFDAMANTSFHRLVHVIVKMEAGLFLSQWRHFDKELKEMFLE